MSDVEALSACRDAAVCRMLDALLSPKTAERILKCCALDTEAPAASTCLYLRCRLLPCLSPLARCRCAGRWPW